MMTLHLYMWRRDTEFTALSGIFFNSFVEIKGVLLIIPQASDLLFLFPLLFAVIMLQSEVSMFYHLDSSSFFDSQKPKVFVQAKFEFYIFLKKRHKNCNNFFTLKALLCFFLVIFKLQLPIHHKQRLSVSHQVYLNNIFSPGGTAVIACRAETPASPAPS